MKTAVSARKPNLLLRRVYLFLSLLRRNPLAFSASLVIIGFAVLAILAPYVSPYSPIGQDLKSRLKPPTFEHPLGTDNLGRDMLSRIIHGTRITMIVGIFVVSIAAPIGTALGLFAGYYGRKLDEVVMRTTDMFLAFPGLILAIALSAALGRGIFSAMLAVSFVAWPYYTRLARASTLQIKEEYYIEAARSAGASHPRIIFSHIFPMLSSPIIVQATTQLGFVVLTAAALGFLGIGIEPPTPEWGAMVGEGKDYMLQAWWMSTFPGITILVLVLAFNVLGDSLRDLFDVKLTVR